MTSNYSFVFFVSEEKWVELPPYGRVVEGKFEGSRTSFWQEIWLDLTFPIRVINYQRNQHRLAERNNELERKKQQEKQDIFAALYKLKTEQQ